MSTLHEEVRDVLRSLESKLEELSGRVEAVGSNATGSCPSLPTPSSWRWANVHSTLFTFCLIVALLVMTAVYLRLRRHMDRQRTRLAIDRTKNLDAETLKRILGTKQLPSWVNFPDFEKVSWVNSVIAQLWPRVQAAADEITKRELQPLLDASKPLWVNEIRITQFDVGEQPPVVSGMKTYDASNGALVPEQVLIEFDFVWGGKQDVHLSVKPLPKHMRLLPIIEEAVSKVMIMKVRITDVVCSGRCRVSLKPLLNELPIVGAVQVSFVESPKFSFNTKVYGGDLSFFPGLDEYIDWFISSEIISAYVLPEKYVYPLIPGDLDAVDMPTGILLIKVIEATDIPNMDYMTKSDPFCRVWVNEKRSHKTQVRRSTSHPVWDEQLRLLVHVPELQALHLEVRDWDMLNASDCIGSIKVPIQSLPKGEKQDLWLELQQVAEAASLHQLAAKVKYSIPGLGSSPAGGKRHDHASEQGTPESMPDLSRNSQRPCEERSNFAERTKSTLEARAPEAPAELDAHHSHQGRSGPEVRQDEAVEAGTRADNRIGQNAGVVGATAAHTPPTGRGIRGANSHFDGAAHVGDGPQTNGRAQASAGVDVNSNHVSAAAPQAPAWEPQTTPTIEQLRQRQRQQQQQLPQQQQTQQQRQQQLPPHPQQQQQQQLQPQQQEQQQDDDEGSGKHKLLPHRKHSPPRIHLEVTYYEFNDRHLEAAKRSAHRGHLNQGAGASMDQDTPPELRDVLLGGVLIVKVKRAFDLVHKPALRLGMLKKAALQVKVEVDGQTKKTAEAHGSSREATFHDVLEFVIGGEVAQQHEAEVVLEVWDYNMINHFKGRVQVPLREVIRQRRLQESFALQSTKHGQLEAELSWLGILEG